MKLEATMIDQFTASAHYRLFFGQNKVSLIAGMNLDINYLHTNYICVESMLISLKKDTLNQY